MISLFVLLLASANAEDSYFQGNDAFSAGRYQRALNAYQEALRNFNSKDELQRPCLFALGLTAEKILERSPDRSLACKGLAWYTRWLKGNKEPQDPLLRQAQEGHQRLKRACKKSRQVQVQEPLEAPPRAAPPRERRLLPWSLTAASSAALLGGISFYLLSAQDLEERDTAYRRYQEAAEAQQASSAATDVQDLQETAQLKAWLAYGFMGTGLALAGAAAWSWNASLKLQAGPEGLSILGRF